MRRRASACYMHNFMQPCTAQVCSTWLRIAYLVCLSVACRAAVANKPRRNLDVVSRAALYSTLQVSDYHLAQPQTGTALATTLLHTAVHAEPHFSPVIFMMSESPGSVIASTPTRYNLPHAVPRSTLSACNKCVTRTSVIRSGCDLSQACVTIGTLHEQCDSAWLQPDAQQWAPCAKPQS